MNHLALKEGNGGKKIMQEEFDKALFQATYENFLSQVFEKQIHANKIQIDLVRKIQGKEQSISSHLSIIKHCRKTIDYVDMILKDVREYFFDLKIDELYNLFDSLFHILVYILKKVSECYLRRFERERKNQPDLIVKNQEKQIIQQQFQREDRIKKKDIAKKDLRQLQILDFEIAGIEEKEQQINNKMSLLISDLSDEKKVIEKIDPVANEQIYLEIERIFLQISQKTQYLFNNFFKGVLEQDNFMRPEQMQDEILIPLKNDLNIIAKEKLNNVIQMLTVNFQSKLDKNIQQIKNLYVKKKSSKKKSENIKPKISQMKLTINYPNSQRILRKSGNESDSSFEKQALKNIAVQKQIIEKENEELKKRIKSLNNEIDEIKKLVKKQQSERIKLVNENIELQKLFKRRTYEFQEIKTQLKQTIQKNHLQSTMSTLKKQAIFQNSVKLRKNSKGGLTKIDFQDQETQTQLKNDINLDSLIKQPIPEHKLFVSMRAKIRKASFEGQEKNKNTKKIIVVETQKKLKQTMYKLIDILFGSQNDENNKQSVEFEKLLKEEKYDQIIQLIKKKLDTISMEAKKKEEIHSNVDKKPASRKRRVVKSEKSEKKSNLLIMTSRVSIGVQTAERKLTYKDKKVYSNNYNHVQSKYKRRSIDSNELQKKVFEHQNQKGNTQFNSTEPQGWIRTSVRLQNKQNKQNEDNNFLLRNLKQNSKNDKIEERQNERKKTKNEKKNYLLENTLFQQINFDTSEMNRARTSRDSLILKMYNVKQKKEKQKEEKIFGKRIEKKRGTERNYLDEMRIKNKIVREEQEINSQYEMKSVNQKVSFNQNWIQNSEIKQVLVENRQFLNEQNLMQFLKRACSNMSADKINKVIQKFKKSCISTRPGSSD